MSDFVLNQADRNSGLWRRLIRHLNDRRDTLRRQNDAFTLDAQQTAVVRGRIAELTELLALEDPAPGVDP